MMDLKRSLDRSPKGVFTLVAALGAGAALMACSDHQVSDMGSSKSMQNAQGMTPGSTIGSAGAKSVQTVPSTSAESSGSSSSAPMSASPASPPVMPPAAPEPASPEQNPSTKDANACPLEFTTATKIVMDVSWPASLALVAGAGKVYVWTKNHFSGSADKITVMSKPCGTTLPEIQTQAIAGAKKILPEIPDTTWDAPGMPTIMGSAKRAGNMVTVEAGVALIGLQMSDPTGPWPQASGIMALDHDGDGAPGITAVPRTSDGFQAPPTSIAQTTRTDKLYLAIRNIMTLSAQVEGCPPMYSGTANVTAFDNRVIGCHIQNGAECAANDAQFVDGNSPVFQVASATFTTKVISATATCEDVRSAMVGIGM